jgi:C-22 sterol desaturase
VFLTGKTHVEYRRGLNTLFTRKALGYSDHLNIISTLLIKHLFSIYIAIQESICRKHLNRWLATAEKDTKASIPIMMIARHLNMETSLGVFCGSYIPEDAANEINTKYWDITQSLELVNFPLALPGTKVYKAIQARKVAMYWLEQAAHKSKIAMAAGGDPQCMLDEWVQSLNDPNYKGRREFSDLEMAMVIFSFLFASQDAMSSGLIYGFQHLSDHPEIYAKVKEEQERVRQGNYSKPLTLEMMDQMTYLNAVVKESMRVKPPVLMVRFLVHPFVFIADLNLRPYPSLGTI